MSERELRGTCRSTRMMHEVARWQNWQPHTIALVLCNTIACAKHLRWLASGLIIGLDTNRLVVLTPDVAVDWARGRTYALFVDHSAWEWLGHQLLDDIIGQLRARAIGQGLDVEQARQVLARAEREFG